MKRSRARAGRVAEMGSSVVVVVVVGEEAEGANEMVERREEGVASTEEDSCS